MASQYVKLPLSGGGGGGGAVDSFNGRTGVVVSTANDYSAALVSNSPAGSIAATNVQAAINELDGDVSSLSSTVSALSSTVAGKQDLDAELTALAGISSNGMLARTGAGTAAARTITGSSNISVSDGDGVLANPTIAITGSIPPANGGLGSASVPLNGQIPIGNGSNYVPALLSVGSGLTATFGPGTILLNLTTTIPQNIDGGSASSIYGGTSSINGGNA